MIMDMLGSEEARSAILEYYQHSHEPGAVEVAVEDYKNGRSDNSSESVKLW